MEYDLPQPDYNDDMHPPFFEDAGKWRWPNYKFELEPEALFTTLFDRFNTHKLPLQNPGAFYTDVCEVALASESLEDFYSGLEERKTQRVKEMNKAWHDINVYLGPRELACPFCYDEESVDARMPPGSLNDRPIQRLSAFRQITRWASFDSLVDFFDGFVRDARKIQEEKEACRRERFRRKNITGGSAAASGAIEAACEEHHKPESPCNASTSTTTASSTPSNRPRPTSSSGRRGQHGVTETPLQTTESSAARKRKNDEGVQGSDWKRRRVMSENTGDDDAESLDAKQVKLEATETTSSTSESLQPFEMESPPPFSPAGSSGPRFYRGPTYDWNAIPGKPNTEYRRVHSATVPSDCCLDMTTEQKVQKNTGWSAPSSPFSLKRSQSPPNQGLGSIGTSQMPPRRDLEGLPAKDDAVDAACLNRIKRKPRANRRQRVDKGGSHKASSARKKRQERKTSPSIDQALRSKRSSRRDTGQKLLFLGHDATPQVAS